MGRPSANSACVRTMMALAGAKFVIHCHVAAAHGCASISSVTTASSRAYVIVCPPKSWAGCRHVVDIALPRMLAGLAAHCIRRSMAKPPMLNALLCKHAPAPAPWPCMCTLCAGLFSLSRGLQQHCAEQSMTHTACGAPQRSLCHCCAGTGSGADHSGLCGAPVHLLTHSAHRLCCWLVDTNSDQ